jgi:hypothetical protein
MSTAGAEMSTTGKIASDGGRGWRMQDVTAEWQIGPQDCLVLT